MLTLALQTDSRGVAAVLVERPKGGSARLLGSTIVPRDSEPAALAAALSSALPGLVGGRPEVAIALSPEEARVRRLPAPPAPEAELPPIIALQAAREAGVAAEELVADFLPAAHADEGPQPLMVSWADKSAVELWSHVAAALGGKLTVATPRPLATLSLVTEPGVVATQAGDAIDFAGEDGAEITLLRSARVSPEEPTAIEREVKRTLLTLEGAERPKLFAGGGWAGPTHSRIDWDRVGRVLGVDAGDCRDAAAAIGLALAAVEYRAIALNLADPRRPPVEDTGRRRIALLLAAAASVLAAGGWMAYERVAALDRQIEAKQAEIAEARRDVEAFEPHRDKVAALDAWRATDVTWLDEFDRLANGLRPQTLDAEDFPAASDVRLTRVTASILTGRGAEGGKIDLSALARTSSPDELEDRLRDQTHPLEPKSIAEKPGDEQYRYDYSAELRVPASFDPEEEL